MSLERAGEFVLEFITDDEATEAADLAYLQAVAANAEDRGYDVTVDELKQAFRSIAVLDDDEDVAGFTGVLGTITLDPYSNTVFNQRAITVTVNPVANTATGFGGYGGFSPLGFLRR